MRARVERLAKQPLHSTEPNVCPQQNTQHAHGRPSPGPYQRALLLSRFLRTALRRVPAPLDRVLKSDRGDVAHAEVDARLGGDAQQVGDLAAVALVLLVLFWTW